MKRYVEVPKVKITRTKTIQETICDNCYNILDNDEGGGTAIPITIYFPWNHMYDLSHAPADICSNKCGMEFFQKAILEGSDYQHPFVKSNKSK